MKIRIKLLTSTDLFPSNLINKCPAIIFAVSRTANLPGRIIFLIVSIKTIKGINRFGVPFGTKWANIEFEFWVHPKIIILNHKGKANVRENTRWLELVKIYGINPIKLFIKINMNNEIVNRVIPFDLGPTSNLNSLWSVVITFINKINNRPGKNQYEKGINIIPKTVLIQFIEYLIEVAGSKVEKRFVIILN